MSRSTPNREHAVVLALMATFGVALARVLQARLGVTEPDTLYHFRMASLVLQAWPPWVDVRWLPFTVLGADGPDHHWLWHVLLAPFALIADAEHAIVIASPATRALC